MSIWQVQIQQTTIWSGASMWCAPAKEWWNIQNLPNASDMADDILIVEYDADGRDHDRTMGQVMQTWHQKI